MVDHMSRFLLILYELLHRFPVKLLPVRFLDPPVKLPVELPLLGFREEVNLAWEYVE